MSKPRAERSGTLGRASIITQGALKGPKPSLCLFAWIVFEKLGIAHTGLSSRRFLFPGFRFAPPWAYLWAPFRGRQPALLGSQRRMVSLAESTGSISAAHPRSSKQTSGGISRPAKVQMTWLSHPNRFKISANTDYG